jgi:GH18 family chitinase
MRTSFIACLAGSLFVVAGASAGCGADAAGGAGDSGAGEAAPPPSSSGGVSHPDAGPTDDGGKVSSDGSPAADGSATQDGGSPGPGDASEAGPAPVGPRVVAYLPNYSGSFANWATTIDFTKMTHLNLAFARATSSNGWDMGASDADVKALVDAAHAAGTKVMVSLGGGGGDQSVIARYNDTSQIPDLVAQLDAFVAAHNFDGVDVDIEDGNNLGANYSAFVDQTVAKLRPEGKLVTAAVAQYLQDSMADATLHEFDFLNVMIYSSYADSVSALDYYANTKSVPKALLNLGAGFFGTDSGGNEYAYVDILKADPSAWSKDQAQVNGNTVNYTGMDSMKKLADYSKGYGGIMFWELSEDSSDAQYSLYKVIQGEM